MDREAYEYGIGVDIGTCFCVSSRRLKSGQVEFLSQRDSFLQLTPISDLNRKMIRKSLDTKGAFYLERDGDFYIVGEHATTVANERGLVADRPLKQGILSAKDKESFNILSKILEVLVGPPLIDKERLVYCYPANPLDANFDAVYHQKIIGTILSRLGYDVSSVLESDALGYSELLDDGLTGVCFSWGAGMTNISVLYLGSNILSFSIARGGDYIDLKVGEQLGLSSTIVQSEKEAGIDLLNPNGKIAEAISIYYNHLIEYVLGHLEHKLQTSKELPRFKEPVKIIISGGTSMAGNFIPILSSALQKRNLGIPIGELKPASDCLTSVSAGCLIAAQL